MSYQIWHVNRHEDEIAEDQYKTIVKGRLQRVDFVMNDGVGVYMDNNMVDWTGQVDEERVAIAAFPLLYPI